MTQIWAHRGASTEAPENTLPAFELARDRGADGVELDVQLSSDGQIVVCHDEQLDRTTTGTGLLSEHTLDELRQLDAGSWFSPEFAGVQMPTLAEVYELLAPTNMAINVELKNSVLPYPDLATRVHELTHSYGLSDRVWYSSFNHPSIAELAKHDSQCGLLHGAVLIDPADYAVKAGVAALHPHWSVPLVQPEFIPLAHDQGLRVHAWTVDDPRVAEPLLALGVDVLISDSMF